MEPFRRMKCLIETLLYNEELLKMLYIARQRGGKQVPAKTDSRQVPEWLKTK
jgi:hypothetical protein